MLPDAHVRVAGRGWRAVSLSRGPWRAGCDGHSAPPPVTGSSSSWGGNGPGFCVPVGIGRGHRVSESGCGRGQAQRPGRGRLIPQLCPGLRFLSPELSEACCACRGRHGSDTAQGPQGRARCPQEGGVQCVCLLSLRYGPFHWHSATSPEAA